MMKRVTRATLSVGQYVKTLTHIQVVDSNTNRQREVEQAYTQVHCALNDRLTAIEESIREMRETGKDKV